MSTQRSDRIEALLTEKEVRDFLTYEANLLDRRELEAWFNLVAEDIVYRMPRKVTHEHIVDAYSDDAYFFNERYESLEARVKRFDSEYAWAERPPSRTRRYVTNLCIDDDEGEEVTVRNNLLVHHSQGDMPDQTLLAAEREDTLRRTESNPGFEIASREIRLDHAALDIDKISIFL